MSQEDGSKSLPESRASLRRQGGPGALPIVAGRRREPDWRRVDEASAIWGTRVLVGALLGLGLGVLLGAIFAGMAAPWAQMASQVSLWAGLSGAVLYAFFTQRPAGLMRIKGVDVLWGLALGLSLRVLQGILSRADSSPFPSLADLTGGWRADWWASIVPSTVFIGPLVEEFFFRGVVVVSVYQVLRRQAGEPAAAFAALVASSVGFVVLHVAFAQLGFADLAQLFLVGASCALLVLVTGRLWGAVLAHATYNIAYLTLALAGLILA